MQSRRKQSLTPRNHLCAHSVVCCVAFSENGRFLATGCNKTAQIYDVRSGEKIATFMDESASLAGDLYIRAIAFSPDGQLLGTGAEDFKLRLWDISKGRIKHMLVGHTSEIYAMAFSADGSFMVSGAGDRTCKIWNLATGKCVFSMLLDDVEPGQPDAGITSVARESTLLCMSVRISLMGCCEKCLTHNHTVSPDSRLIACGSLDAICRVWDTASSQQLERLKSHRDSVYSVAFSPDGSTLYSSSLDKTVKSWDLSRTKASVAANVKNNTPIETGTGTCSSTFAGHKDYVLSIRATPDGQWVASASKDRTVIFWDTASCQPQFLLQGHKNSSRSQAAFSSTPSCEMCHSES